jgi:hypothetical protein
MKEKYDDGNINLESENHEKIDARNRKVMMSIRQKKLSYQTRSRN